jgi:hypothetical protein
MQEVDDGHASYLMRYRQRLKAGHPNAHLAAALERLVMADCRLTDRCGASFNGHKYWWTKHQPHRLCAACSALSRMQQQMLFQRIPFARDVGATWKRSFAAPFQCV